MALIKYAKEEGTTSRYVNFLAACLQYRSLWMGSIQFDPDRYLSTIYTTKLNPLQSAKNLNP